METVTFTEVKIYLLSNYKPERLYGRNSANGWHDGYGDNITSNYWRTLNDTAGHQRCIISRHEHISGHSVGFGISEVLVANYSQLSLAELCKEKQRITHEVKSLGATSEKLRLDSELNQQFAVLNVRLAIIRQSLRGYFHQRHLSQLTEQGA